mmetsp:Transcript_23287/g.55227  ORF Transcript_23287/g.55227 Transcript_23287/m.55227 type:complete len:452 (+) Transcript_23287:1-1356(+)
MAKQTMGTPLHSFPYRSDNKIYRLSFPQRPLVGTQAQDEFQLDDYPNGANAVVAVLSLTGFDMEDAMIINKSAAERGFGHGSIFMDQVVDLADPKGSGRRSQGAKRWKFDNAEGQEPSLDGDGLPAIGTPLQKGSPLYRISHPETKDEKVGRFKYQESGWVQQVKILGSDADGISKVTIKQRVLRNPIIGDKFSSRHGQKGVLSVLWPQIDMPFSDSGITPDVIINPHAFPSRMTIGMLVESMAGKAGACHGHFPDATPFRFDEHERVVDYVGHQLREAGYQYYGNESLYCGYTGEPLKADIFIGLVYYQRLRHMVSDKFQVRSNGPVNQYTRQPVKGRKAGGGVRFGEMERDALLAHGAAFLLRDRLMTCSDGCSTMLCHQCGSLLAPMRTAPPLADVLSTLSDPRTCHRCQTGDHITTIAIPYVVRYLTAELLAMNIQLKYETEALAGE